MKIADILKLVAKHNIDHESDIEIQESLGHGHTFPLDIKTIEYSEKQKKVRIIV